MSETIVIVGGGQAGGVAAASLREQGYAGAITLVAGEARLPYQRPPLSKNYLAGQMTASQVELKPQKFYVEKCIQTLTGTQVAAIDRGGHTVALASGETLAYDRLLLATGARARPINVPGATLSGVHMLRTLDDVDAIRSRMHPGRSMVVIGGGYIGLEVAAIAQQGGMKVTVLESAERILGRVTGGEIAEHVAQAHRSHGVEIRCGVRVEAISGTDAVRSVECSDAAYRADVVVVGIGVVPNVELAAAAGLQCDNGIMVDEYCRTGDERIYAAGDCSCHPNGLVGRRLRLESVQNAVDQARAAASNMCGNPKVYRELPWFWSNQYDIRLQMAGISQDYERTVTRGDPSAGSFSVLYVRAEAVIAADTVNAPREHLALRKLIGQGGTHDLRRLADAAIALPN